jgi:hypothetical protein
MADGNGNGHDTAANAAFTEQEQGERETLRTVLDANSLRQAYHSNSSPGAIHYLVEIGKTIKEMSMRVRVPRKRSDAYRLAVAISQVVAKSTEFGDANNIEQVTLLLGLLTSDEGKGRDELVNAIIGDFKRGGMASRSSGMGDWIKQKAGVGQQQQGAE